MVIHIYRISAHTQNMRHPHDLARFFLAKYMISKQIKNIDHPSDLGKFIFDKQVKAFCKGTITGLGFGLCVNICSYMYT